MRPLEPLPFEATGAASFLSEENFVGTIGRTDTRVIRRERCTASGGCF